MSSMKFGIQPRVKQVRRHSLTLEICQYRQCNDIGDTAEHANHVGCGSEWYLSCLSQEYEEGFLYPDFVRTWTHSSIYDRSIDYGAVWMVCHPSNLPRHNQPLAVSAIAPFKWAFSRCWGMCSKSRSVLANGMSQSVKKSHIEELISLAVAGDCKKWRNSLTPLRGSPGCCLRFCLNAKGGQYHRQQLNHQVQ